MADALQCLRVRRAAPRELETRSIRGRATDATAVNRSECDRSSVFLLILALQREPELQWTASVAQLAAATDAQSAAARVALRRKFRDALRGQQLRFRRYDLSVPDRSVAPQRAGSKP